MPAQQSVSLLHVSPAPTQLSDGQVAWQTPWLPGAPPVEQQLRPELQAFWVPVVQGSPSPPPPVELHPTLADVQMPAPPGVVPVAQQTRDESPQPFWVPTVHGHPCAGRARSPQKQILDVESHVPAQQSVSLLHASPAPTQLSEGHVA